MTRALALALGLALLACANEIAPDEVHDVDPKTLTRIAVLPFLPSPDFRGGADSGTATGGEAAEAAARVTRIVSESFAAIGFDVIPASDVVQLFEAAGRPVPHGDPAAFAQTVAREFGATSALSGTVYRYHQRHGGDLGATRPASVGIELVLRVAPGARQLWSARFDHTQQALSENALVASRYPGGGTRWLTAEELTRWGLEAAARKLADQR
jgi:hypothetical protein